MPKSQIPRATIGIVLYNSRKFLEKSLPTIIAQDYPDFEVVILDNASSEPPPPSLHHKEGGNIKVLHSDKNLGFAGGHNQLFHESRAEYYFCLNPDVLLAPDYLSKIIKFLEANPTTASATGKLLWWDFAKNQKTDRIDSLGLTIYRNQKVVDTRQGQKTNVMVSLPNHEDQKPNSQPSFDKACPELVEGLKVTNEPFEVFGVSGAAAVYRRSTIGNQLFDESFFAYKEDIDTAYRLRWAGQASFVIPTAVGWHARTASMQIPRKNRSKLERQLSFRNHFLLIYKNFSANFSWQVKFQTSLRNLGLLLFALLREPFLLRSWREARKIGKQIQPSSKDIPAKEIEKWFR